MSTQPDPVGKLHAVINKLDIDIVELADMAGLGTFIPYNLRQYGKSDFTYHADVRSFLEEAVRHDGRELEIFFEELNRRIRKYNCCKRYESNKCKKYDFDLLLTPFDDSACEGCKDFIDNGLKNLFLDALAQLGYTVNGEGFIVPMQPLDAEREITKILSEATKVDVSIAEKLLPWDIIKKAKEMAEVYVLIYCIENSLRMFIKYICTHQYGDNYIDKIQISERFREKIRGRKVYAEKNKWLPIRGEDDLFYLDIEDLGKIIQNNWELFKSFFPDQHWITQKIKEIQDIRNLVAHNSYVGETERNLLKVYYKQILKQIVENWK